MGSIGWDVAIALIIAVYGAVLSTYTAWAARQEKKRKIKVELSYGFSVSPPMVGPKSLFISALNMGKPTVTLTSMGLVLPDKRYLTPLYPKSNVSFPYALLEGKNCSVWIELKELAEQLKQEGYSGKVSLIGFYNDAIGGKYKSKPLEFDIEKP